MKYFLSTGLMDVREKPEFNSDKEAWNYLVKSLYEHRKSKTVGAILYHEIIIQVPANMRGASDFMGETSTYHLPVFKGYIGYDYDGFEFHGSAPTVNLEVSE